MAQQRGPDREEIEKEEEGVLLVLGSCQRRCIGAADRRALAIVPPQPEEYRSSIKVWMEA